MKNNKQLKTNNKTTKHTKKHNNTKRNTKQTQTQHLETTQIIILSKRGTTNKKTETGNNKNTGKHNHK